MTTVLFETQHLYYLPQFLPIMSEMGKRKEYQLFASLGARATPPTFRRFQEALYTRDIQVITGGSERERVEKCKELGPDVLIVGNVGQAEKIARTNTLVVMVYHGIGLKESYYRDSSPRVDLFAVESQERYEALINQGFEPHRLALTGFTKLDPLFNPRLGMDDQDREKAVNSSTEQTILYAPTFYPSSIEQTLQLFLRKSPPGRVFIKLHQFSWELPKYRHHVDLARRVAQREDFVLIPQREFNILPYYRAVSVLVSDLSSTIFEYLALDRPIVQTLYFTLRKKHRVFPFLIRRRLDRERMGGVDFTVPVHEPKELIHALKQVFVEDTLQTQRKQAVKRYHYRLDGFASQRLLEAIANKLGHGSP